MGGSLEVCCTDPMTGFYRNGMCTTGPHDHGLHTVCIHATEEFLEFSRMCGNNLSTPALLRDQINQLKREIGETVS